MNMGHHGVFGKGNATFPLNMFEESVKVPCIFSQPGTIPAGQVNKALLSQYDFMPTLLDYLGIKPPEDGYLCGKSFADILRGNSHRGILLLFLRIWTCQDDKNKKVEVCQKISLWT